MDITTAAVYEHEMAKNEDFRYGFESIIRNTAVLDRMLISAEFDYVIGGMVTPAPSSLGIQVGKIWGNGATLDLPVYCGQLCAIAPKLSLSSNEKIYCKRIY